MVAQYLYSPLIHLDENLLPAPGLAVAWDISADGREYTFHLHPRATFSDGTPVRASDVIFTLAKIVDPASEAAQIQSGFAQLDLTRTRATSDKTVIVAFREALASQLVQFNNVLPVPEHIYKNGNFRDDYNNMAVGSGPYKLVRRVPGNEIVMQRRDDYWERKPYIETVVFKVILNDVTAWNAAKRGDVDETAVPTDVWLREQSNTAARSKLDFLKYYGLAYNYVGWNSRNPLFSDKRVRLALSKALDLKAVNDGLYGGTARAINGHFTPDLWGYNPQVKEIAYDLAGSRQLLASLGWKDSDGDGILDREGKPFRFELLIMNGSAQAQSFAQIYQASLKQVGIEATIAIVEFTVAFERILAGNYEATYLSWDLDPDPDPYSLFHSTQTPPRGYNHVGYNSRAADRLIEQGRREFNTQKRTVLYQQLHAVLAEDQPYTWVNQPSQKWVLNKRIRGVREGKGFGYFLWYPGEFDWWLSDAPR